MTIETVSGTETELAHSEHLYAIPEFLKQDDELLNGYSYLLQAREAIEVDLYLARHQSMQDLGAPGSYEATIRDGGYDAVAIEALNWKAADQELMDGYSQGKVSLNGMMDRLDSFGLRTVLAMGGSRTPVILCDVQSGSESATGSRMIAVRRSIDALKSEGNMEATLDKFAEYQNMREWYAVGRLGSELQRRLGDAESTKTFLSFGAGHSGLAQKLAYLGVKPNVIHQDKQTPVSQKVADKISKLAISINC